MNEKGLLIGVVMAYFTVISTLSSGEYSLNRKKTQISQHARWNSNLIPSGCKLIAWVNLVYGSVGWKVACWAIFQTSFLFELILFCLLLSCSFQPYNIFPRSILLVFPIPTHPIMFYASLPLTYPIRVHSSIISFHFLQECCKKYEICNFGISSSHILQLKVCCKPTINSVIANFRLRIMLFQLWKLDLHPKVISRKCF
jgi:hypothetical protein